MIHLNLTKAIIIGLVLIGALFWVTSYVIEEREKDIVAGMTLAIAEQEKVLLNIADVTDRNKADAVVEKIIVDCSNRSRFDTLLNRLAELNQTELAEIRDLYDGCADFFAKRKAVMVARMEREYEIFTRLIGLLAVVDDSISIAKYKVTEWGKLVELEKKRSAIFANQVKVQFKIIEALQDGQEADSEQISKLVTEANDGNQEAEVLNHQINALRGNLIDI